MAEFGWAGGFEIFPDSRRAGTSLPQTDGDFHLHTPSLSVRDGNSILSTTQTCRMSRSDDPDSRHRPNVRCGDVTTCLATNLRYFWKIASSSECCGVSWTDRRVSPSRSAWVRRQRWEILHSWKKKRLIKKLFTARRRRQSGLFRSDEGVAWRIINAIGSCINQSSTPTSNTPSL